MIAAKPTLGAVKEWRPPDNEWRNALNWESHRTPCSLSDVVIPTPATDANDAVVVSITLDGNSAWRSVDLPAAAELVLDDNWTLV